MLKLSLLAALALCSICPGKLVAETGRYRLTLRNDAATSVTIGWDQISGEVAKVYIGKKDHGKSYEKYTSQYKPDRITEYKGMKNCFVRLTSLSPNSSYFFVIKDNNSTSKRFWFKTAPDHHDARLSVIAGGDSRNNRDVRQNANKMVAKLCPHFVMFGGDMTRHGTDSQWKDWLNDWQYTIASDGRMFPVIVARGNHERSNEVIYNLFDTPSENIVYALNISGGLLRVYTLNTEISVRGDQTDWLKEDLRNHQNVTWRIMQYHKPMRPHVLRKYEGYDIYECWSEMIYNYKVKLVVECDAHTVKRTWPIKPANTSWKLEGFVRDDENGTVFVGEGCWGAPTRSANDPKVWTRASGEFNQFKWIFIDKEKIELRTVKVDNVDEVEALTDDNIFSIPGGIDIWDPPTGSVIEINR